MSDREEIVEIFSELKNFADYDVHPVVSPENWNVYSKLRDLIDQAEEDALALLKEQEAKNVAWSLNRAHCPTCGELFPKKKDVQYIRFCSYCGQAVKWDE